MDENEKALRAVKPIALPSAPPRRITAPEAAWRINFTTASCMRDPRRARARRSRSAGNRIAGSGTAAARDASDDDSSALPNRCWRNSNSSDLPEPVSPVDQVVGRQRAKAPSQLAPKPPMISLGVGVAAHPAPAAQDLVQLLHRLDAGVEQRQPGASRLAVDEAVMHAEGAHLLADIEPVDGMEDHAAVAVAPAAAAARLAPGI